MKLTDSQKETRGNAFKKVLSKEIVAKSLQDLRPYQPSQKEETMLKCKICAFSFKKPVKKNNITPSNSLYQIAHCSSKNIYNI